MKRKAPDSDEREAKRQKLDTEEDLNVDAVHEIFKYLDDVDLIRLARVSKIWNKSSHMERNRFIKQKINRLKLASGFKDEMDEDELIANIENEIEVVATELEALETAKKNASKSLAIIHQFYLWRDSTVPKTDYKGMVSLQPEGEMDVWDMKQFSNDSEGFYKGRTFDLNAIIETIEDELDVSLDYLEERDPDEPDLDLDRLEKYLKVLMERNFGSAVYDW